MLKRIAIILIFLSFLLGLLLPLSANALEAYDTALLYRRLQIISNQVNNVPDSDNIASMMAPNHDSLLKDIDTRVVGKTIHFNEDVGTITEVNKTQVRIEGKFEASGTDNGRSWSNAGRNFFTFNKVGDRWLLADTDFYKALGVNQGGGGWFNPWLLLFILVLLGGLWLFVLNDGQRQLLKRLGARVVHLLARLGRWLVRLVQGKWQTRRERKQALKAAEPEIIEETPMAYEQADEEAPIESAAPAPHHREAEPVEAVDEPVVEVHHYQEDAPDHEEKSKLDHNLGEEKD